MGQFVHDGILYEELPNGQARVIGPAQGGPVFGPAKTPSAQTQAQAQGDQLGVVHTQQQIDQVPLQNENTRVNIQQGQTSIANTAFGQKDKLRSDYQALPPVRTYNEFLPALFKAVQAPDNAQGDLAVLYSFSKAMDPTTGVREGEQSMARNTASLEQQAQVWAGRVQQGERLPPAVRQQFVETMRETGRQYARSYGQQRQFYTDLAHRNGYDPAEIVGPDAYSPFANAEQSYVTEHGGTPKVEGVPVAGAPEVVAGGTRQGFDLKADARQTQLSPEQSTAYDAFWKANPNPSPEQLVGFVQSMGVPGVMPIERAQAIIAAAKKGRISHDVEIKPDISDMRGHGGAGEKVDAAIRGAADTASFGLADKIAAVGDTLVNPDTTLQGNLAREYAISDYDTQKHFPSRLTGQIAGGFAVPMGEMSSVPQAAIKSGAAGAAYGAGSSRSLSDVPGNALMGFTAGAGLGAGLAGAGRGINALRGRGPQEVPPLVDPQTGQLNQPLEAMTPGQRVVNAEEYGINLPADAAGGRTAAVIGKGLDIMPGSAGVMEDARRATESQVAAASDVAASRFGDSRTMNEAGSELQRGANERIERGKSVIGRAYDAIPISAKAPTNLNNTKATLDQLAGKLESNPDLQQEIRDPKLLGYLDALNKHGLSWQDLKDFRTFIGDKIGEFRFSEDARTGDYRSLYAALSEDMRNSAAAQGPGALRAFERANTLNRQNEQVIDGALTRLLGKDGQQSPEKAAAAVQAMTKGGKSTGDLRTLAQIRSATVKSGAWNEIASTLIRMGGQPANSPGRDFNPQTFVHWYADMSESARAMLFGNSELRKSLDGFVAVNQRLQKVNALRNTSNTAGNLTAAGTVGTMAASIASPALGAKMLGVMAGNYAMAKAWTNPAFVRLITGYSRAVASGNQNAVRSQIGRIGKLATTNPELREPLIALQQRLLSGANDNAMLGATASDSNSEEN